MIFSIFQCWFLTASLPHIGGHTFSSLLIYFVLQTNSMINSNNQSFSNFSFCLMSFHFLSLKSQTDMDLNIGCERLFHSCCFLCFLQENNVVVFCSCFVARKTTCCFLVVFYKKNKAQNYYPVYCNNNLWYRRDLV